jgi:predicted transcriptional regulator
MFTCDDETKTYLEEWAETENRTLSNLMETLVREAIAARKGRQDKPPASSTSAKGTGGKGKTKGGDDG